MIKKIVLLLVLGVSLSGCFMVPLAFVGPAVSGFSTASLLQSGFTSGASYLVKQSTGKSFSEHAFSAINNDDLTHTYFPDNGAPIVSKRNLK